MRLTGRRESSSSPFRARSFKTDVLSLSSESERRDTSGSNRLIAATESANRCLVPSPVSVPLKMPPNRPPKAAARGRNRRRTGKIQGACRPELQPKRAVLGSGLGMRFFRKTRISSSLATGRWRSGEMVAIVLELNWDTTTLALARGRAKVKRKDKMRKREEVFRGAEEVYEKIIF